MTKLKRIADGKIYDCMITEGRINYSWDDVRIGLLAVYYNGTKWNREPLANFVPAEPGVDY